MPPVLLHQAQNGWYDGLTLGPEAVNAHKTVGGTLNIANSGAGWGWGMEKEKVSWGKRKELERQKNCVGRKEIASKQRGYHMLTKGTSIWGHPKGLSQGDALLDDTKVHGCYSMIGVA